MRAPEPFASADIHRSKMWFSPVYRGVIWTVDGGIRARLGGLLARAAMRAAWFSHHGPTHEAARDGGTLIGGLSL